MTFAASISEHPVPATAVGEVVGEVIEKVGEGADLVCLFVSPQHAGALEDIAAAVHTLLDPKAMIGCAADSVIGPGREAEAVAAISLWAGDVGPVHPVRLEVVDSPGGGRAIAGWPIDLGYVPAGCVLLADPFSFPVPALFDVLNRAGGFPRVVGGMASAAQRPGGNRLVLDGRLYDSGAVGVLIAPNESVWMETVVAPGVRPVGSAFVATRADGNVIYELGGRPALTRLTEMLRNELSDDDMGLAQNGLLVGRVIDEHKTDFGPGDFVVRSVLSTDPLEGSVAVGERIQMGSIVQFHLRDARAAHDELLGAVASKEADGALLFSGTGRGRSLFEQPDHDAGVLAEALDDPPVAGIFAAGEFGPVDGRNAVHGFSASMALFTNR